jgi:hypothetical protein
MKMIDYGGTEHLDVLDSESESEAEAGPTEAGPSSTAAFRRRERRRKAVDPYGLRRPRRVRVQDQMSAKLHCLYGWGLGLDDGVVPGTADPEARKRAVWAARQGGGVYALACSKVYDLREYTPGTEWGPFLDAVEEGYGEEEGVRVDWEKVLAILIVLGTNIRSKGLERFPIFWHFWGKPFAGTWRESYIPWSRDRELGREREVNELDRKDPYGVSGSWLRVVSFLGESPLTRSHTPYRH